VYFRKAKFLVPDDCLKHETNGRTIKLVLLYCIVYIFFQSPLISLLPG